MLKKTSLFVVALALLACLLVSFQTGVVASDTVSGDTNGDGRVNSNDALYLLRSTLNSAQYPLASDCGDMNGDGRCNSNDALYLLRSTLNSDQYPLHTHSYGEELVNVDDDYHAKVCSSCHYAVKVAHEWSGVDIITQPTCSKDGVMNYVCLDCNASKTGPTGLNPEGHQWNDGVITTQPTFSQEGEKTYTCDLCQTTKTEPVAKLNAFELSSNWKFVYSDNAKATAGYQYMNAALKEMYSLGRNGLKYLPDTRTDIVAGEYEILIGGTNRPEDDDMEDMKLGEYGYYVVSDKVIVIGGGSGDDVQTAVKKFLSDVFGYTESGTGEAAGIPIGKKFVQMASYPVTSLKIDGVSISEYTIIYKGAPFKAEATRIAERIGEISGYYLPVVASAPSAQYVINVGSSTFDNILHRYDPRTVSHSYCISAYGNTISISSGSDHIAEAINVFLSTYLPTSLTGDVALNMTSLKNNSIVKYFFDNTSYWSELVLTQTSNQTQVCAGVTSFKQTYKDRNGTTTVAYIVDAKPGSVTPVHGTKNNVTSSSAFISSGTQTPNNQAIASGLDVCAVINGSLYNYDSPTSCYGLYMKNGVILSQQGADWSHYPIFAVMKDGSYFIGFPYEININDIWDCAPGRFTPLRDNVVTQSEFELKWSDSLATRRHARTAIGLKADGSIVLCVIESNSARTDGATLGDLGQIMQSLGCVTAINMDGGGSSVCYIKDYSTGNLNRQNAVLGGSYVRPVINSVMLVRNPNYQG